MSYSIYLCHPMALRIVQFIDRERPHPEKYSLLGLLACVYALALLFGFFGQHLVETPFIKLGSLLSRRLSALIDPVRRGTSLLVS
jgi:peptidoglycan/LPS O-acetylase OafA/YrhL